ncbi:hypothetical protein [Pseudomonas urethralis]|uniref:hypothetical protein n=1 Tax=Pseudomonas urethralis TaxID=2740517 RepID=UPI001596BDB4|nr:hypothetical protein [Pseudomonas urethralis]
MEAIVAGENDLESEGGVIGDCALCLDKNVILKESHSIPKFAYDWLKKSSRTPYIRHSSDVNVRHQDGPKEYLLCGKCEGKLSVWEKILAEKLFRKIANYRKQPEKVVVTEEIKLAVLSIFWRALLTTKDAVGNWTDQDKARVEIFLKECRGDLLRNHCEKTIYFAPFHGLPPYYGLPQAFSYMLERAVGAQDIKFTDNPHRYIAAFKLPFMYFYMLSDGWGQEDCHKVTELTVGEIDISRIADIPGILKEYITMEHEDFVISQSEMNNFSKEQIRQALSKKMDTLTGADKSLARAGLRPPID